MILYKIFVYLFKKKTLDGYILILYYLLTNLFRRSRYITYLTLETSKSRPTVLEKM